VPTGVFSSKSDNLSVGEDVSFTMSGGGIIDDTNSAQYGKVAYIYSGEFVRNTTAGPSVNMNSLIVGSDGGWE
jgi:hypothetical protein